MSANTHDISAYRTPPTSPDHFANYVPPNISYGLFTPPGDHGSAGQIPHPHPRRSVFNPNRPIPTLRRESNFFGEDSQLGMMVLESAGVAALEVQRNREHAQQPMNSEPAGVRAGWMVAMVNEDNGSQFSQNTQGSAASQNPFFSRDSQNSQSQPQPRFIFPPRMNRFDSIDPSHFPSTPTIRVNTSSSSRSRRGFTTRSRAAFRMNADTMRESGGNSLSHMIEEDETEHSQL